MRRAVGLFLSVLAVLLQARPSFAVDVVDAIGMIDYTRKPTFTVGSWVKYHVTGTSMRGINDDYTVTVVIAGEEFWWGEHCFWVETRVDQGGQASSSSTTLMSYEVFEDSLPQRNFRYFMRKMITGADSKGRPIQELPGRPMREFKQRRAEDDGTNTKIDTLGVDTVTVPKGQYAVLKVKRLQRAWSESTEGDSSFVDELRQERVSHYSTEVPITSLVREDLSFEDERKGWLMGQSQQARKRLREKASGSSQLVGFGTDEIGTSVPEQFRKPLREQRAARRAAPSGARQTGRKGG